MHDDVITQFNDFKLKREPYNYRYFIYKIVDDSEIVIDSFGPQTESYDDFAAKLAQTTNDCRYGLIDLDVTTKDGRPTSKLVFLSWYVDSLFSTGRLKRTASCIAQCKPCIVCACAASFPVPACMQSSRGF